MTNRGAFIVGLMALSVSAASHASGPPNFVPDAVRTAAAEWGVDSVVPQAEIKTEINESKSAMVAGGGLLFAMIDAGVNSSRTKKAEAAVQPLRDALAGYNFDDDARDSTGLALSSVPWLKVTEQRLTKDDSQPGLLGVLDSLPTSRLLIADYGYSLSPTGDEMVIHVALSIASRETPAGKKPADRLKPKYLAYQQRLTVVAQLNIPAKDLAANVARWSADGAALARKTLASELADVRTLIVRSLTATEADVAPWAKDRKKTEEVNGGTLSSDGTNLTLVRAVAE